MKKRKMIGEEAERAALAEAQIPGLRAAPRGIYGYDDRPEPTVAPITFVGGTGRSGTHVVARVLGKHRKLCSIPVECLFHVDAERGFPALLEGRTTKADFLDRLNGFWWQGRQRGRKRGLFRVLPRERFDLAVAAFEERFDDEPEEACRQLFLDLLWPQAIEEGSSGLVEQSCDTIAEAATLLRLFPEARFIHVVRDGRDSSASRVSQTIAFQKPRTRMQGLEWWERRIRAIDAGRRAIPEDRYLEWRLEWLLSEERRTAWKPLAEFTGVGMGKRIRSIIRRTVSAENANTERWREGVSESKAHEIETEYESILGRLGNDGVSSVALLRQDEAPV